MSLGKRERSGSTSRATPEKGSSTEVARPRDHARRSRVLRLPLAEPVPACLRRTDQHGTSPLQPLAALHPFLGPDHERKDAVRGGARRRFCRRCTSEPHIGAILRLRTLRDSTPRGAGPSENAPRSAALNHPGLGSDPEFHVIRAPTHKPAQETSHSLSPSRVRLRSALRAVGRRRARIGAPRSVSPGRGEWCAPGGRP